MITWMQRHKKYLIVTIWISTIAFIGAGFVGWGQYDYGDKAGAVAKVGEITITQEELQKGYSGLFNQYNQLFGGKLDEKQAQAFGLQRQALKNLIDQALILNLAENYSIQVSDEELLKLIQSQDSFHKDGAFNKELYAQLLTQNHITIQEYENTMRRDLLIQKTLMLFNPSIGKAEELALAVASGVSDTVEYKLLTPDSVVIQNETAGLRVYWEKTKNQYKKPSRLELSIAYPIIDATLEDTEAQKEALRRYVDFKKGSLDPMVKIEKISVDSNDTRFSPELLKEISALSLEKPFLKPRKVNGNYIIIKLDKVVPATTMTFNEASAFANIGYSQEMKKSKLQQLAQANYKTFSGTVSDSITSDNKAILAGLSSEESAEFVQKLFGSKQKQGFLTLQSGNVILYNVLAQKLLQEPTIANNKAALTLKGNLLHQKLLKTLEAKYPVKIYVEGI